MKARDVTTEDQMMASVQGRYASALFDLAAEQSQLEAVENDLGVLQAMLDESADLRRMVRSPVFSAEDQTQALDALLSRAGASTLTSNFVKLVTRNRRLFVLPEMIKAFRSLAARSRGEVEADVTSAMALNDSQLQSLKETLKASIGKDVQINAQVDASLLGGLIVKIGSRMIDSSLRTKLSTLKMRMKEVG
ncbi:MAG: F0F1 ATP synthase subunit delta [Hyphomicrobiaceae bacterium]